MNEKTVFISEFLLKRIEKQIQMNPELSFSLIVNEALELWLRSGDQKLFQMRDAFIRDDSQGFGPRGNHPNDIA